MKFATILLVALVCSMAIAENCADHPYSKRNVFDKILKGKLFAGWTDPAFVADADKIINVFKRDSTATDGTTLVASDFPLINSEIIASDGTTCCTPEVYTALTNIPKYLIQLLQNNPSRFERLLGGFQKVVKKCGIKKKGDGEEGVDVTKVTLRAILKKLPAGPPKSDGEEVKIDSTIVPSASSLTQSDLEKREFKGAIELVKVFLQGKAQVFSKWIDLQRGNIVRFACRKPSLAKNSLKANAEDGDPKIKPEAVTELTEQVKQGMIKIIESGKKLGAAIRHAFKIFGDSVKCSAVADKFKTALGKSLDKACGDDNKCDGASFDIRILDLGVLRVLVSRAPADAAGEGTGKLDDKGDVTPPSSVTAPPSPSSRLRNLADATDANGIDTAAADDADAIGDVADSSQPVTFGGVDAEGNCNDTTQCDYSADENQYNEDQGLTAGGITPASSPSDDDDTMSSSGTIITAFFATVAFFALL